MFWIDVVSRITHIATAITLVGGSIFTLFVLIPSAKALDETTHQTLLNAITQRWKKFVHVGVLLFLVSGFYNYVRAIPSHKGDGLYHALIGTKMILAFGVFFLAAALVGRSEKLAFIRAKRKSYLTLMVVLAITIVSISGFAKVRPYTPLVRGQSTATSTLPDVQAVKP